MSTFCSSKWVAKACRSECIDTRLSIPAASAPARMARLSCRAVNGSVGSSPGNSPPLVKDLAVGMRHTPPRTKTLQQQRREHGVTVLAPLALFDAQRHALAVDVADLE